MGFLESLHQERKERLERIKQAAEALEETRRPPFNPDPPVIIPPSVSITVRSTSPEPPPCNVIIINKFDLILTQLCMYYKVAKFDILSQRRSNFIAEKRHVFIYLLNSLTNMSYSQIGKKIGRDHTTVTHAMQKMRSRYETYKADIEAIQERIRKVLDTEGK